MKKQVRFFMDANDEQLLENFLKDNNLSPSSVNGTEKLFNFGDEFFQILDSEKRNNIVTIGRIAIMTLEKNDNAKAAEAGFKMVEKFIKRHFSNEVVVWNEKTNSEKKKLKDVWLGPSIKNKHKAGDVLLKQSFGGFIFYSANDG